MTPAALTTAVLAAVHGGCRTAARIVVALRGEDERFEVPHPVTVAIEDVRDALATLHAEGAIRREVRRDHRGRESIVYRPLDDRPTARMGPPLKPLRDHVRRVLVSLHQSDLDALDAYAARLSTSRSAAIAQLARDANARTPSSSETDG